MLASALVAIWLGTALVPRLGLVLLVLVLVLVWTWVVLPLPGLEKVQLGLVLPATALLVSPFALPRVLPVEAVQKALEAVWKALEAVWKALEAVRKALEAVWKALGAVRKALGAVRKALGEFLCLLEQLLVGLGLVEALRALGGFLLLG